MNAKQHWALMVQGYFTVSIDMRTHELEALIAHVSSLKYDSVFQEVGGRVDPYRLQSHLSPTAATNRLYAAVGFVLKRLQPEWETSAMVALKSLPGGMIQDAHTDMDDGDVHETMEKTGVVPVVALVAIMPDTKLRVYWGCFNQADRKRQRDVQLGVGDMLVFRGDLVHCGLAYAEQNIRIHVVVGFDGCPNPEDSTFGASFRLYKCTHCKRPYELLASKCKHEQTCKNNPKARERDRVLAARKAQNDVACECPVCLQPFPNRAAMRQHKSRKHKTS